MSFASPASEASVDARSAIKVQHWYRGVQKSRGQVRLLQSNSSSIATIASELTSLAKSASIEYAQEAIISQDLLHALEFLLRVCAPSRNSTGGKTAKTICSALLISKFPDEVLQQKPELDGSKEAPSLPMHLDGEALKCLWDARAVFACLRKLVAAAAGPSSRFSRSLKNFNLTVRWFTVSFDEWRKSDARRMAESLAESFLMTYSVYIEAMTRASTETFSNDGPTATDIIMATQKQLEKIRTAMVQVMGKQAAASKIEEVCAAVEAAYYSAGASQEAGSAVSTPASSPRPPQAANTATATGVTAPAAASDAVSASPARPAQGARSAPGSGDSSASVVVEGSLNPSQMKILDKLAALAGMAQERLAYEIVLNPYYRLPPLPSPFTTVADAATGSLRRSASAGGIDQGETSPRSQTLASAVSGQDTASVLQTLKAQMLRVMGDKLVNSLRRSPLTNFSQVTVGQIVPVFFMPNGHSPELFAAGTGSVSFVYTRTPILSARVLAITSAPAAAAISLTSDAVSPSARARSPSPVGGIRAPSPVPAAPQFTVDVEFTADGLREDGVAADRIVLADSAVPDPTPLVVALHDLGQQIASFTPNRPDIQQEIMTTVDVPLLSQMIVNRALDPVTDLLPILQFFQRSLQSLQAPSRTAVSEAWIRDLADSFHKVDSPSGAGAVASSGQRRGKSIDEVAPLLPQFFERASAVVEEIQRDMANYYISVLVPVLQTQGADYLRGKFQQRLLEGRVSLDATASLVYGQLLPEAALRETVKDLVEAGACVETGFALTDLVLSPQNPPAVPAAPSAAEGAAGSSATAVASRPSLVDGVVARAILSLLQLPVRLDSPEAAQLVPEVLAWDASRLASMRDLVDRIALECSLVIACKQVMARYQLPPWCSDAAAEVELQHRLDVLLTEKDTSMASITAEVVRYVQEAVQKFRQAHLAASSGGAVFNAGGASPRALAAVPLTHPALVGGDSQEIHERVSKGLKDVVAHGNPVLSLFSKRVYKVLLRAMLGQGFKHLLPSYSLQSPAQQRNLSLLIQSVCRLFAHTMKVHRDVYLVVIGRAVASTNDSV